MIYVVNGDGTITGMKASIDDKSIIPKAAKAPPTGNETDSR
jgi:hypothetical protein